MSGQKSFKFWKILEGKNSFFAGIYHIIWACLLRPNKCTEVRFASFLSGGFTTMAVINPPERKLAKRISLKWRTDTQNLCSGYQRAANGQKNGQICRAQDLINWLEIQVSYTYMFKKIDVLKNSIKSWKTDGFMDSFLLLFKKIVSILWFPLDIFPINQTFLDMIIFAVQVSSR